MKRCKVVVSTVRRSKPYKGAARRMQRLGRVSVLYCPSFPPSLEIDTGNQLCIFGRSDSIPFCRSSTAMTLRSIAVQFVSSSSFSSLGMNCKQERIFQN